jgi:cation diffusion facilitator CzcD-associated flavoprotein CzcO
MRSADPPRVAVVGAGAAGLECVRTLTAAGLDVDCFERERVPGGHWHHDYESLHLITPRDTTCFDGYPMPAHYPLFPSRDQVRDYLLAFTEAFGLAEHIRFGEEVTEATPAPGGWRVRTTTGTDQVYDALVVANGHLRQPRLPPVAGDFTGHALHSGAYRAPSDIHGDRVLVVGAGNSGCDLAVDAAMARKTTYLSMRRGQVFQPKTFFGRSRNDLPLLGALPMWLAERVSRSLVRIAVGTNADYPGLPRPSTPNLNRQPPVVNSQLLYWIQHGRITVRPEITSIDGTVVTFSDGTRLEPDTVLWATGFAVRLPFLEDGLLQWRNGVPLRVGGLTVPLGPGRLYLAGLASPRGAQLPVYSAQARLIARMIRLEPALSRPLAELLEEAGPPDDRIDILRPVWFKQMAAAERVLATAECRQEVSAR